MCVCVGWVGAMKLQWSDGKNTNMPRFVWRVKFKFQSKLGDTAQL